MKSQLLRRDLIVKSSPIHRYGVFAGESIKSGEVIEECPCVVSYLDRTIMDDYMFEVDAGKTFIVVFGYGSIYNHSEKPNAAFTFERNSSIMVFRAKRDISRGEEIFISYGDEYFSTRKMKLKQPFRDKYRRFFTFLKFIFRFGVVLTAVSAVLYLIKK